jgi:hypothetical protein
MYQKIELVKLTLIRLYQEIINFLKFFYEKEEVLFDIFHFDLYITKILLF